ncbi:hypothetical protein O6H91_02G077300 [Diphasiastrum complanatum]|uniref:Uncharacterized protein n=1 Tax=Diphasiastrum complanatum TaxID=34168 RepID=A0ACC2EH69_DIPCM|nr:hypothetical protein O6H91_02G077300 [Diphasiastrum complanatum]
MGSSAELSLGCKKRPTPSSHEPSWAFVMAGEQLKHMHMQQLPDYIKALEEERRKIDAFKRELPLCMQLLNDAIQESKEHLAEYQTTSTPAFPMKLGCDYAETDLNLQNSSENPLLEEFMPLNHNKDKPKKGEEEEPNKRSAWGCDADKPSWMAKAQLWSEHPERADMAKEEAKQTCSSSPKFILNSTHGSGGAFSPFVRGKQWEGVVSGSEETSSVAKLTLSSGMNNIRKGAIRIVDEVAEDRVREVVETQGTEVISRHGTTGVLGSGNSFGGGSLNSLHGTGHQNQRKARRCWSPELHRRFLSALEQLGGSQVATPKQIRELMKVDGLTNDEVKSHLQKYRLHTRRPSPVLHPAASPSPQVVVLGGIWMPPEYAVAAQPNSSVYDQVPSQHQTQFFPPLSKESLTHLQSSAQGQLNQTLFFEQQAASHSKTSSQRNTNSEGQLSLGPEGSSEGCGEESIGDDAKSDNTSRKGDSHGRGTACFRDNKPCRSIDQENVTREQLEDDDGDVTEAEDSRGSERIAGDENDGHAI